jgi:transcriptional regulator with XRE-family HTH domain
MTRETKRMVEALGGAIRDRRTQLGLRQRAVAKALSTSVPSVSLIENGKRDLRFSELVVVAKSLRTSAAELVSAATVSRSVPPA